MNSGTRKTLIAGTVGAALGGIALARRRTAGDAGATISELDGRATDTAATSEPLPSVMEMPAASGLDRAQSIDPAIE